MKKFLLAAVLVLGSLGYVFAVRNDQGQTSQPIATSIDTSSMATASTDTASSPTNTVVSNPTKAPVSNTAAPKLSSSGQYRDGTYPGSVADAYYGNIQVEAVISGGKLANVKVLQYPNDRRDSIEINQQALPILVSEAISAQSARVDAVSGASDTSPAFTESLSSALAKAKA